MDHDRVLVGIFLTFIVCAASGIFTPAEAASIGIIGGADGPTAIFVTSPTWTHWVVPALILVLGIYGFRRLCKCKQK